MEINVQFFGAAEEVTGSCHLVQAGDAQILLDCGLIQGRNKDERRNCEPFPFDPASVDAVVLSHAHIDHSGRLPLLVKAGYRGPIYTHRASRDLCRIMLKDAAFLQEKDAEWENRKRDRKGLHPSSLCTPLPMPKPHGNNSRDCRTVRKDAYCRTSRYALRMPVTSLVRRSSNCGSKMASRLANSSSVAILADPTCPSCKTRNQSRKQTLYCWKAPMATACINHGTALTANSAKYPTRPRRKDVTC